MIIKYKTQVKALSGDIVVIPNGSLNKDRTTLSINGVPMRSPLAKYLPSSLFQSMGSWVPTTPQIETRDKETKYTNLN